MNTERFKHLAAFLRAAIGIAVVFEAVNWTEVQVVALLAGVETLGALIYANNKKPDGMTTTTVTVEAPVEPLEGEPGAPA